jgi:hypothetical protein
LAKQKPALYDGLDVPHRSDNPAEVEDPSVVVRVRVRLSQIQGSDPGGRIA